MARSCGIHIDQRRFHVVALDGSAKKHRVVAQASGEISLGVDPVEAVSDELRAIAREHKLRVESVGLAVDSGLAAFRNITVPFDDRAKIEDTIKFEIESDLPQWDIDDVIVDFLVLSSKPGVESNLLVTAIPKLRLERQLAACEKGGLEASDAELDGTALFEAARASGALSEDASQVLVHVGDSSTTVVVVDGGRLASMRAIRAGALPKSHAAFEEGEDEEEEGAEPAAATEDETSAEERLAQTAKRIRRELGRTVSSIQTEQPIEAIYFCGHPLEGLMEEGTLFDVEAHALGAFPGDEGEGDMTVAYGAALRALGAGHLSPHLRREDLKFTGKFERLELPLAVFSLLLCTLLGVQLIVTLKQIHWRDEGDIAANLPGDMQLWLQYSNMYLLPNAEQGWPGRLKDPPEEVLRAIRRAESGEDEERTKYQEFLEIKRQLFLSLDKMKRDLGHITDVKQPQSALRATTLVMNVLDGLEQSEQIGRFSIRSFGAEYKEGRSSSPDKVEIRIDMDFFADESTKASQDQATFRREVENQDWCLEFAEVRSKPFENGGGLSFDGIKIEVDVSKASEEPVS
jgi:Tfp pilus assembly PilM family ATPase